jgi:hypothetical protein
MKTKLSIAVAAGLSLLVAAPVLGFKPSDEKYMLFFGGDVPDKDTHRGMTGEALNKGVSAQGSNYKFNDDVIEQIKYANSSVDGNWTLTALWGLGFSGAVPHCDDEELAECSNLIRKMIDAVTAELTNGDPDFDKARQFTGEALHTVQDFYSHSNYAHLYDQGIKSDIATLQTGFDVTDIQGAEVADNAGNETCEWEKQGIIFKTLDPTNTFGARGNSKITSGYFQIFDPIKFKCIHGGESSGINKDYPGNTGFATARQLAVQASEHFVATIFDNVLASGVADAVSVLEKYTGQSGGQVAIVIDASTDSNTTLLAVKAAMTKMIKSEKNRNIGQLLLMPFGADKPEKFDITDDSQTFVDSLNKVTSSAAVDGECSVRPTDGLRKAVQAASQGAHLFLYTDGGVADVVQSNSLITEAIAKNIVIDVFTSDQCNLANNNDAYATIAKETGGSVYRYKNSKNGIASTFALVAPQFSGDFRDVTKIVSSLPASNHHDTTYVEHNIMVDSTVNKLVLAVDMSPLGEIKLFRPDGSIVLSTDSSMAVDNRVAGTTLTLLSPEIGQWRLGIAGKAKTNYQASVKMNSDIGIVDFAFAEVKGREGHMGLLPVHGDPLSTEVQKIVAVLSGNVSTAQLVITALDGSILNTVALTTQQAVGITKKYAGLVSIPNSDFRVYIQGHDADGNEYQRMDSQVYHGHLVAVRPVHSEHDLAAGTQFVANFEVRNSGATDTFDLVASNTLDLTASLSHSTVSLDRLEQKVISVTIDIPADAEQGTAFDIMLNANSQSNAESKNVATRRFVIHSDTDGDGVSDHEEKGQVGTDSHFDGNNDGIADYQQATVASMYAATGATYMTFEIIDNGTFASISSIADPSLGQGSFDGIDFRLGHLDFDIAGLATKESTSIKIHYAHSITPSKFYQYGKTADNLTAHWYEYTDINVERGSMTITLTDGMAGDGDVAENGLVQATAAIGFVLNQPPQATDDMSSVEQNTAVTIDLLVNDLEPDSEVMVIYSVNEMSAQGGTVLNHKDGTVTYTPKSDFAGTDSFEYTVMDNKGALDTAMVAVTVTEKQKDGGGSTGVLGLLLLMVAGIRRVWFKTPK